MGKTFNPLPPAQWGVVHETITRVWRALNGEGAMPPSFPQEVVDSLDDNLRIIYFDLIALYDAAAQIDHAMSRPYFKGYYKTLAQALALPTDRLRQGDFVYVAEIVPPSTTSNAWAWTGTEWEDTGRVVPDQTVPPSTVNPAADAETGSIGTLYAYARADHRHPRSAEEKRALETLGEAVIEIARRYVKPAPGIPFADLSREVQLMLETGGGDAEGRMLRKWITTFAEIGDGLTGANVTFAQILFFLRGHARYAGAILPVPANRPGLAPGLSGLPAMQGHLMIERMATEPNRFAMTFTTNFGVAHSARRFVTDTTTNAPTDANTRYVWREIAYVTAPPLPGVNAFAVGDYVLARRSNVDSNWGENGGIMEWNPSTRVFQWGIGVPPAGNVVLPGSWSRMGTLQASARICAGGNPWVNVSGIFLARRIA